MTFPQSKGGHWPVFILGCWPVPQAVSERLSRHVLKNWKRFVEGINEVATIEHDLEASPPPACAALPPPRSTSVHDGCCPRLFSRTPLAPDGLVQTRG